MESITKSNNFIEEIIQGEIEKGIFSTKEESAKIITRFPPEPNGYLHIGHAKSIFLNFGLAERFNGKCNLRFDDTNPEAENSEFVNAIIADLNWLGVKPDNVFYASNYFGTMIIIAKNLILKGRAYVDSSTSEEIALSKGTPTTVGTESLYRNTSPSENLLLFEKMINGDFEDGSKVLRAKIDMSHVNMHMRDPIIYRIKKEVEHHNTGIAHNVYPMYDFAHPISDAIEGITHSICTLEFASHRDLYDYFVAYAAKAFDDVIYSKQIEFARMNLSYTILSKRHLSKLVDLKLVSGWDDPRMPTIAGMRRRGYPAEAIKLFCEKVGVSKRDTISDFALLESCVRNVLNKTSFRVMAVLDPISLFITNYLNNHVELVELENNPEDESTGKRKVPFSNTLFIEREDFIEEPIKGFNRLYPGAIVRLKGAYIVRCTGCIKDDNGNVVEVTCEYIPNSISGNDTSEIKSKGTIHWLSSKHAFPATIVNYENLLTSEVAEFSENDSLLNFNYNSATKKEIFVEPSLINLKPGTTVQFIRKGYFCLDHNLVFNKTVSLKDGWKK